ncbi:putative indole-3-acetic acid-amido synthetase GH3.11 [Camellia lanceoleosa]|uniref:Indole-3-acetic acid-amido synthetase GH3.11 n=1 Tax=Camellia lanceoleosa TaxID=1840588 RepID=A0ACC0GMP7_9ERIC|nr:putative indole-3-acetic acid-amido synthetase GH3.11 [Camellia lanceoleosa]
MLKEVDDEEVEVAKDKLVDLVDVRLGCYYELVVTTFADVTTTTIDAKVIQECCIAVEKELDYIYRRCRANDKSVRPLEIRVVKPGTFEALVDIFIDQGGSIN